MKCSLSLVEPMGGGYLCMRWCFWHDRSRSRGIYSSRINLHSESGKYMSYTFGRWLAGSTHNT